MKRPAHGGNLNWAASIAGCSPSEILDFSASINPLGPPTGAISAIADRLKDLGSYPDPNYHQLRVALAQVHQLPPEWILPGNGAAELLTWAGRELAERELTYAISPGFGDYWRSLKAFDARVQRCPLDLEEARKGKLPIPLSPFPISPAAGLLLNNPHNPTGILWSREAMEPYLAQFDLVVVDEAFMDFLPSHRQESLIPQVEAFENLVVVRSLTKFYSIPGLRLGYAIAHPHRLQRWQQWRDPWAVNVLAAAVGVAVVQDTEFQQQTWNWLVEARSALFEGLARLPGLSPLESAANFLLVQSERSSSQVQQRLLQHHRILIRDCLSFPELGDRYFRVAVRTQAENQRLIEGLAEVLNSEQ